MNFFICNRYETKNEDIYLIRRSKNPTKKSYYYEEEYYDSILNPEKTFILTKNDNQKPETESIDNSEELQIIEYPYKHQQAQNNLKKGILNKSKMGRSFINNFQYFAQISNMNNNEEKKLKKDLNKNSSNACLSTNFERNVDDRLLSDDFEFDLEDTIKGEDNINIKKLNMENKNNNNNNNSYFYPVLNKEKKINNNNNLDCKNHNDKNKVLNNIPKSYKSNLNTNKKDKKPTKKKIDKKKILHPSKSFRKDSEISVNKYRNLNLFNKNLTNNFNKSIKNKNKSNIYNKKKEFNWIFSKSLNTNKSSYTDISYTHRNLNKYKKEKLNHKKLSGNCILTCGTNTNTNEIKNKKLNDNYDFDIASIIKEKFKKNIINSHFLKKGKLNEKEKNNYSTKEVIRQFRHYKRKYLP